MGIFSENYSGGERCSDCSWANEMESKVKEKYEALKTTIGEIKNENTTNI